MVQCLHNNDCSDGELSGNVLWPAEGAGSQCQVLNGLFLQKCFSVNVWYINVSALTLCCCCHSLDLSLSQHCLFPRGDIRTRHVHLLCVRDDQKLYLRQNAHGKSRCANLRTSHTNERPVASFLKRTSTVYKRLNCLSLLRGNVHTLCMVVHMFLQCSDSPICSLLC